MSIDERGYADTNDEFEDEDDKISSPKAIVAIFVAIAAIIFTSLGVIAFTSPKQQDYLPAGVDIGELVGGNFAKKSNLDLNGYIEKYADYDEHAKNRWRSKEGTWILLETDDDNTPRRIIVSTTDGKVMYYDIVEDTNSKLWRCDMGSEKIMLPEDAVRVIINAANEHYSDFS